LREAQKIGKSYFFSRKTRTGFDLLRRYTFVITG
jgi:hypothetical protein